MDWLARGRDYEGDADLVSRHLNRDVARCSPTASVDDVRAHVERDGICIGAATALRLAAEGADVAITARTLDAHPTLPGSLTETAERARAHGGTVAVVTADMADASDRTRIVPEAAAALGGPIDILVNNAA